MSALVIAGVLLIAVGMMLIPFSKKSTLSDAPAVAPSTTGVAPKHSPPTSR